MMTKTLTIVATAFNEPYYNRAFIYSMLCQTVKTNWKAIVFHNGPNEDFKNDMSGMNDNIVYRESEVNTGQWGCRNRQTMIDECDTDYILQTSVQDYFLPQACEYMLQGLEKDPDILLVNSINHLVGPCQVLDSKLEWSKADWGNVIIRTSIAKQIPIRFGDQYCGDWGYFKDIIDSGLLNQKKLLKLNAIINCHN